jgi:hypothetical protein
MGEEFVCKLLAGHCSATPATKSIERKRAREVSSAMARIMLPSALSFETAQGLPS